MSENDLSGLDAVAEGPASSDQAGDEASKPSSEERDHPTVQALYERFGDTVRRHHLTAGDQYVVWVDAARSHEILTWLKEDEAHAYDMLSDVTAVDYGSGRPVNVVYQLYSIRHKRALRLRCELPVDALEIDSVFDLWKAANWLEREVYDLFGVTFRNHPDLRRILMPSDYAEGHPLRKDFPLRGRFSRAEQTKRALAQDIERYYGETELGKRTPQEVLDGAPAETPTEAEGGA